jgi:hypothetical protein
VVQEGHKKPGTPRNWAIFWPQLQSQKLWVLGVINSARKLLKRRPAERQKKKGSLRL